MRALELQDSDLTFRSDYSEPVPSNDEVNVRILKAGICETDLQLVRGYMGFRGIPGHEFVGIPVSGRFEGCRVVGEINCPCGECTTCKAGRPRHCPHRSVVGILNRNGAFADLLSIPEKCLHPVPDHVPNEFAVFVEPVAAACRIIEQQLVRPNDSVLILGAGRLGNLCAQVLKPKCGELLVVGKHAWKLSRIAECEIESEELQSFVPQAKWDIVVDCTGSPSGLETALHSVRACGTIVLKTTIASEQSLHMAPVVIDETRIVGSRCGPFEPAMKLISEGRLQLAPMISATYDIEAAVEAFQVSSRSDVLKVQLNLRAGE
ncbi:MAG: alcohol dehydrogenase catalytic domain-containing protein [Fuerstiella sp.]|nr:alcohol dehydrogenase catalytic domain-containing protein [Fuerstiella sp.]